MPSAGGGRIILVLDGDPPAQKNKVYIIFLTLDLMGEVFYMLILTFGHYLELLIQFLWYWQVHEVVKMMEIELGDGWIFHKNCKVINIKFYCLFEGFIIWVYLTIFLSKLCLKNSRMCFLVSNMLWSPWNSYPRVSSQNYF